MRFKSTISSIIILNVLETFYKRINVASISGALSAPADPAYERLNLESMNNNEFN